MFNATYRYINNLFCNRISIGVRKINIQRLLAYICSLILMSSATSSYAVKCVQAGYTAVEGAIICHPSYINPDETREYAFVSWPRMSFEPPDDVFSVVSGSPFCGVISGGMSEPEIGEWGNAGVNISQRSSLLDEYSVTYHRDYGSNPRRCTYGGAGHITINRIERAYCPEGYKEYGWFYKHEGGDNTFVCGDPPPAKECFVGNPIGIMHGTKIQHETHINANNLGKIPFSWHYVAKRQPIGILPHWPLVTELPLLTIGRKGWKHNYDKRLYNNFNYQFAIRPTLELTRPDKTESVFFVKVSENWTDAMDEVPHRIEEQ